MALDAGDLRVCPCCNTFLSVRQIGRHRARRRRQLQEELAALDEVEDDAADQDIHIVDPPPEGAGLALDDAELAADDVPGDVGPGDAIEVDEDGQVDLGFPDGDAAMSEASHVERPPDLPPVRGLRRNPPVRIEDWPDPDDDSVGSEDDDESDGGMDRDPEYVEHDLPPRLNPEDEPAIEDDELRALLDAELGDLADEEWIDMYARNLSARDHTTLKFLATRLRTHFSRQTYDDLRRDACAPLDIPSEFIAWRRLRILSGLETRAYDCCVNSCCCFLGRYRDLDLCPFCQEPRRTPSGTARRFFRYTPLIPQLQGLFQNSASIKKMRYRVEVSAEDDHDADTVIDVFDGENYRTLRNTRVREDSEYRFFDSPNDVALSLATDGFTLFKRRRRGLSTAWPIILVNLNLPPKIRSRLENVLCVGVIPGPKQCKDLNSFLIPLLEELLELADGVDSSKVACEELGEAAGNFVLRAFIIIIFGDIPAVAKLLAMKGHNAITPCRACYIQGVLCRLARNSVYYVPLTAPNVEEHFPVDALLMRTQALFRFHFAELDAAPTKAARARIAKDCGINSRSIFASLNSIDLASCAPYDIMHLLYENLVPNMIRHWTGTFKGLNQGTGNYQLSGADWAEVGRLTAQAARTIPAAFVGTLPNIAEDANLYKAEAYSFWFQCIAPIVLKDRLEEEYYQHFLLMREIFIWCLEFEITSEQIDELQDMVNNWVEEYERLYYQYEQTRLPICPLTIHALLHIPYYIRRTGPLWCSWAFVMERFCGHLLPAVKNRVQPYTHLDNYVQRRAQMQIVSRVYDMPSLARPKINYRYEGGERMSSRERWYEEFPTIILGTPIRRNVEVTPQLTNQLTKYFGTMYDGRLRRAELLERIDTTTLVRYGPFRLAGDGDKFRVSDLIARNPAARDNSFVRYEVLPDRNAAFGNRPDEPVRVTHYGQLDDIYYVEFMEDPQNAIRKPYLLARVKECQTHGVDASLPENPVVKYSRILSHDIIHADAIVSVVGRVRLNHTTWAIIDRRNGARTQFIDEDDDDPDEAPVEP